MPAGLQSDMDTVLNKKFSTSTTYPPNTWPDNVNLLGPLPEKTASGAIANITDGADGVPLKNWLVTLPASLDGYSEVNGSQNLGNFIELYTRASHNGVDYSINADGSLHRSGTAQGNSFNNGNATAYNNCPYKLRAGTYTLFVKGSGLDSNTYVSIGMFSASGASLPSKGVTGEGSITFTVNEDFGAWYYCKLNSGVSVNDDVYIWINGGSASSDYVPYEAPTQYTAQLGRTIYGGTADIVTGEGEDENGNAFTFTPITADTALGVNNFWADEGDSDVTYRADISLALQAINGGRGLMMMRPTEPEETEETEETEGLEDELNR